MTCEEMTELISAQIDGELTPEESQQLFAHLEECECCRDLQLRMRRMEAGFQELPERTAPPLRRPGSQPTWAWWGVAVAAAAVGLVVWRAQPPAGSSLYFSQGQLRAQAADHHSGNVRPYVSRVLHGKLDSVGHSTSFELYLDSQTQPSKGLQLELAYDFDGDGSVDRRELYESFSTDGQEGWQVFSTDLQLVEAQGEMGDFRGGRVTATLKNAPPHLKILEGRSRLILPHQITS